MPRSICFRNSSGVVLLGLLVALSLPRARAAEGGPGEGVQRTVVFSNGQDGVREYRIPVLLASNRGTLLAFCDARLNKSGDPPNYIDLVMKRSTDQGRTWGPLRILVDPHGGAVADSCGVVDRQTGTIWVFSCYCPPGVGSDNAAPGLSGATVTYRAIRSEDDGQTWSAPIDLTAMVKRPSWRAGSFGPGVGIQLRSGRLVLPRYFTDAQTRQRSGVDLHANCLVCYSDDHGRTWSMGQPATSAGDTNECQVAELSDGSVLLNMRVTAGNRRKCARSRDGGVTWSAVTEDAALIDPHCQASLASWLEMGGRNRGWLIFSNPASSRRSNLMIRVSRDDGRTWPVSRLLNVGPSAYSCLAVLPDSTVGCLYERGDRGPYEQIAFARFGERWFR